MSNWSNNIILCNKTEVPRTKKDETDLRTEFDSDIDRILFSSAFRRLQDKAQVFPLEKNDFVRSRLTHSLEVASIARSIGVSVENKLIDDKIIENIKKGSIPAILNAAGLAHDIGNPPFGHYGEEVIKRFFKKHFDDNSSIKLKNVQKEDLLNFDGNCQSLRIVTRLYCLSDFKGMHLTYATLATLMKYPQNSVIGNRKGVGIDVRFKKFGYFYSEKRIAEEVLDIIELRDNDNNGAYYRHPLSFILEAADDIAYSVADIEDGYKKGLITFDDIKKIKEEIKSLEIEKKVDEDKALYIKLEKIIEKPENECNLNKKIECIRIAIQGNMIISVVEEFIGHIKDIEENKYTGELLLNSKAKNLRELLKELASSKILCSKEIESLELAGEIAIEFLLDYFVGNVIYLDKKENLASIIMKNKENNELKLESLFNKNFTKQKKIFRIISKDYVRVAEEKIKCILGSLDTDEDKEIDVLYTLYQLITDYISSMTDSYCISLYKKLKGIDL